MSTTTRTAAYQPPPHGTPSRYSGPRRHNRWQPCRCEDCRTAMRRADKLRELRRSRGTSGYANRDTVATHLRILLDHGWSGQQVADAADLNRKTVWNILKSDASTVHFGTARAILRLVPTERPDGTVSSIGSMRRSHALAAMGWPLAWTAAQAGLSYTGLRDISAGRTKSVQRAYHDAIQALYRTHAMRPGPSDVARRVALSKGWATAVAWDDDAIDDPAARPATAAPVRALTRNELASVRRAEIEHLNQFGIAEKDIAARLNIALKTVQGIVRELRSSERRDRTQAAA
ncbi:hypothetical protein ACWCXC_31800 [Streptomyces sp. NPDC001515]